jgi:hypothetical protein
MEGWSFEEREAVAAPLISVELEHDAVALAVIGDRYEEILTTGLAAAVRTYGYRKRPILTAVSGWSRIECSLRRRSSVERTRCLVAYSPSGAR